MSRYNAPSGRLRHELFLNFRIRDRKYCQAAQAIVDEIRDDLEGVRKEIENNTTMDDVQRKMINILLDDPEELNRFEAVLHDHVDIFLNVTPEEWCGDSMIKIKA